MTTGGDASCLGCGSDLASARTAVHLIGARLVDCPQCRSWNYLPRPSADGLIALHDDDDYFSHPYFENRRRQQQRAEARCRRLFGELVHDTATLRGAQVLDVGAGGGELLDSARRLFGIEPTGVDVARYAVAELRRRDISAVHGTLADVPAQAQFDHVLAIDVIEHLHEPRRFVADIAARLRPGGLAYLETPNRSSIVYELGRVGANLTAGRPKTIVGRLFPPQHVVYFSRAALLQAAREAGLEVVGFGTRTLPMLDIGGSWVLRGGMGLLQLMDHVTAQRALICLTLKKVG